MKGIGDLYHPEQFYIAHKFQLRDEVLAAADIHIVINGNHIYIGVYVGKTDWVVILTRDLDWSIIWTLKTDTLLFA